MPYLSRRFIAFAAGAALVVGPLAATAPSTASPQETIGADSGRATYTLVAQCSGNRPYGSTGFMSITHRFPLPANGKWKQKYERDRSCMYRNPRAKLRIVWARGAGSFAAMQKRIERAESRPGFKKQQLHRHGARFDSHTRRTNVAEFTFLNARGKRQHVRVVGDKYTMLWIRSSQKAWRNGLGKTANRAHRGMSRSIAIAMSS